MGLWPIFTQRRLTVPSQSCDLITERPSVEIYLICSESLLNQSIDKKADAEQSL